MTTESDTKTRLRNAYDRYRATATDRGANVLTYGEWVQSRIDALHNLINMAVTQGRLEAGYFEQFRGDEPAEQPDPFYDRR